MTQDYDCFPITCYLYTLLEDCMCNNVFSDVWSDYTAVPDPARVLLIHNILSVS